MTSSISDFLNYFLIVSLNKQLYQASFSPPVIKKTGAIQMILL